jgi:hypothetical protein
VAIYTVELDGNQFDIEGPDGASEADLRQAAMEHQSGQQPPVESNPPAESPAPTESKARQFIRKGANALPTVMGIGVPAGAALVSGGASLPATALLAGSSAAAGEGIRQAILSSLGDQAPTLAEAALPVVKEGVTTAGLTYLGGKALQGVGKAGKIAFAPRLATSGAEISGAEIAAGARLPRATETLVKVARTADKARGEVDKISRTLENFAEQEKQPTARFLTRQKDRLDLILNKFGKSNNAKDQIGQDAYVKASAIKKQIVQALNEQIPERIKPAAQYAAGKTREKIVKGIGTAAKKALLPASVLGGLAALK